jgi:hypothetical protein
MIIDTPQADFDRLNAHLSQFKLHVWRVVQRGDGRYHAMVGWSPHDEYTKHFPTQRHESLDDLYQTLFEVTEDTVDIFKDTKLFRFLIAEMLPDKPVVMTIKNVFLEELDSHQRGKEEKPIVVFNGTKKILPLNMTNAKALARLLGRETNDWIGAKVYVQKERISVGGKQMWAVRIGESHPPAPKAKRGKAKEPEITQDEIDALNAQLDDDRAAMGLDDLTVDGKQVALLDED